MTDYIKWLRAQIGPRKIILVYAAALVRDGAGNLLFQHRLDFDRWGLPGGVLEIGETFRECVTREVAEETGLQVHPRRLVGLYSAPEWDVQYPNSDQVQQFTAAFECEVVGGQLLVKGDHQENDENRFFPLYRPPAPLLAWYAAMLRDLQRNYPAACFDAPRQAATTDATFIRDIRRTVGTARLIIVGASVIIQNAAGQVLLGLRSDTNTWGLPAGAMDLGETPANTAIRETWEEMGVRVRLTQLASVVTGPDYFHIYPDGNQIQTVSAVFRAEIVGGQLQPDKQETLAAQWFPPDDLPPMLTSHYHRLRLALAHPEGGQFQ